MSKARILVILAFSISQAGCIKKSGQIESVTDVSSPQSGENCAWVTAKEKQKTVLFGMPISEKNTSVPGQLFYCCAPSNGGAPVCDKAKWSQTPGVGKTQTSSTSNNSALASAAKAKAQAAASAAQREAQAAMEAREERVASTQADSSAPQDTDDGSDAENTVSESETGFRVTVNSSKKFYLQCGTADRERGDYNQGIGQYTRMLQVEDSTAGTGQTCTFTQGGRSVDFRASGEMTYACGSDEGSLGCTPSQP